MQTPWGKADHIEQLGNGLLSVSTPSHGGIYVPPKMRHRLPSEYQDGTAYSPVGWFEEDCDWIIPALAFPECFAQVKAEGKTSYQWAVWYAELCAKRGDYLSDVAELFGLT